MKHTILYVAANPQDTDRLALDEECAAIERELRMTTGRDDFEFRSKWAVSVDELMRHLNELEPTILHFSGHGGTDDTDGGAAGSGDPRRDLAGAGSPGGAGILLQDGQSRQYVSDRALAKMIAAAAPSTRVVVLNACYSIQVADALRDGVDCVVGFADPIEDTAARSFAVAFYRALGNRRSIGNAVEQATAVLEAKHPGARAECTTRDGLDADRMFLPSVAADPPDEAPPPRAAARPPVAARGSAARVDIGILTIRDDEFRAVLAAFPDKVGIHKGTSREYALCAADAGGGKRYRIAISRLIEQGNGEAQDAARDLIDDLTPRLVLVVGIAGAPPSEDVKLGDVVVSTRIHDFTVEARKAGEDPTYSITGGPIDKALAAFVTNLAAHDHELGDWTAQLAPPPPVAWEAADRLYGPPDWQRALRDKLAYHYGAGAAAAPVYATGPIAASNRLVKDPELLIPWLRTARDLRAIEMESAGVYRAVRGRCPMLAIRGISDIVGLKRSDAWTKYACASAAAFSRAFLRTRPIGDPA